MLIRLAAEALATTGKVVGPFMAGHRKINRFPAFRKTVGCAAYEDGAD
ncbi:MAG: hypothetical protein FD126_1259 [Elusimicrobia bacterium]|nr:MAG: hypothetical protein FD126_1259 [Elusimicrobiota bacterium]